MNEQHSALTSKECVSADDLEYMLRYWRGCKDHIVELADTTTAERTMAGNFLSALAELKESRADIQLLRQELREVTQRHQVAWDLKNKHLDELENEVAEAHGIISAFDSEIASGNVPDRLGDLLEKLRPTAPETCATQNMHNDEWWQAELDRCVGIEQAKYRALFDAYAELKAGDPEITAGIRPAQKANPPRLLHADEDAYTTCNLCGRRFNIRCVHVCDGKPQNGGEQA